MDSSLVQALLRRICPACLPKVRARRRALPQAVARQRACSCACIPAPALGAGTCCMACDAAMAAGVHQATPRPV